MEYNKITQKNIDALISILGKDKVYTGNEINEDFSHDELAAKKVYPDVLVEVNNSEEISKVMRYAYDNNIPVTPRGQGTGLVGSAVAVYGGIMLSLCKMNNILEMDESNMTLTVESGVLLMDIISYLDGTGYFYAPDPGEKSATIGGNINTNAGGMRAMKYGVTRENVLGLEIVYPNGEMDKIGGKIVKTSSGYSLKDIIIGSEGTLVIVTKAILKLLPVPKFNISLLVPFPSLEKAIEAVPTILKSKIIPTALEFTEREAILNTEKYIGKKFPHNTADAYLILTFDGNTKSELEESYEKIAHKCLDAGAIDVFISNTPERNESIWSARGTFLEAIKASTTELDECDVVVPRDKIAEFIKFSHALQKEYNIQIRSFGHAGDGNLHIYVLKDDLDNKTWEKTLDNVFERLYTRTEEIGGNVSGEHGIGYAKVPYLKKSIKATGMKISKGIKEVFDPKLILNPGKIIEI
ncbi:MAG TPA: FAD-linked oxidase C-terminal domain-containing protein [Victivallales bacterium]|nr:FAD-linked oxidase C-terminal domain-containing protein [Victivallales bacterium]